MSAGKIPAILVLLLSFFILPNSVQAKYSGGSGTAGAPYRIGSAADLLALAADTNDYDKHFVLTADINLAPYSFTTALIAPDANGVWFSGSFNGNGHTISNLTIDTGGAGNDGLGLFGCTLVYPYGEIKNLGLKNVSITGGNQSYFVGGLVGWNNGSISNCFSTGNVTGGDSSSHLGGLVGINGGGSISNCFSTCTITGGDNLSVNIGGLAGANAVGSNISGCYATGDVIGGDNSYALGGLVGGNAGDINNCYSTGTVTGGEYFIIPSYLGGLVGWNNGSISNCYSIGAVTAGVGASNLGGLVGVNFVSDSNISSCYFLLGSGPLNGLGTPLDDTAMKKQASFVGVWDFDTIWVILEGLSYPKLSFWQLNVTKCTITAGSKTNSDKISLSGGNICATVGDFNDANVIEVTIDSNDIVNPCVLTFPIDANTFKKGKYSYSKTVNGVKKSFTYDVKIHRFAFSASNLDLSGLGCPLIARIDINDFNATALLDEAIVNGPKKPIPIQLMTGVKNVLRVDECTVKQNNKKVNSDQLSVSGAFAVENTDVSMTNRTSENLVITLGAKTFTIPKKYLKPGKDKFSFQNAPIDGGGTATGNFNFNLCSFTLTIKNADIDAISGDVNFGVLFAGFGETVEVTLP